MDVNNVIQYPDDRLWAPNKDGKELALLQLDQLTATMFKIMRETKGVGLAAPQIGINIKVAVVEKVEGAQSELVLINPEIIEISKKKFMPEGCLSVKGFYSDIIRGNEVIIKNTNLSGESWIIEAEGFLAQILQHEIDHLNGILFVEKLSPAMQRGWEKFKKNLNGE